MRLSDSVRYGDLITAQQQADAVFAWLEEGGVYYQRLARRLGLFCDASSHARLRCADSILQKMRKAQIIEYKGGEWHLVRDVSKDDVMSWVSLPSKQ